MGTNYFAVKNRPTIEEPIHIGKSSAGWRFLFHSCEWFQDYNEFLRFIKEKVDTGEYVVLNEYDEQVRAADLIEMIEEKQEIDNEDNFNYEVVNKDGYRFVVGWFR